MASRHEASEVFLFEDIIYVALGTDVRECKPILLWAVQNSGGKRICILHVHQPPQLIPFMGTRAPASKLNESIVREYREKERQKMQKTLDDYLLICRQMGVQAKKVYTEMDCIKEGIVDLISQHHIKKLVMGAAAEKQYKKKMMELRSTKAMYVREKAPVSCHIQFICKGNLIHTRQSRADTGTGEANPLRSRSVTFSQNRDITEPGPANYYRSQSVTLGHNRDIHGRNILCMEELPSLKNKFDAEESSPDEWDGSSRRSPSVYSTSSPKRVVDVTLTSWSEGNELSTLSPPTYYSRSPSTVEAASSLRQPSSSSLSTSSSNGALSAASKRKSDHKKGKSQSSGDDLVEVSPPMTDKVLGEETITALSVVFPVMGEEPPTDDPAEETGQPMQGSQDSQDPKASRIPSSQSPHLECTPSPISTVFPQSLSDKGALGDTPLSKQTGQTSEKPAPSVASSLESESSEESSGKSGDQEEEALPQETGTGSEPVIPEGIVKPVEVADLHPEQKAASPPASASGDTAMGDASKMAALDLDSRLSSFLARFDLLEFNSLPASHFHVFGSSYGSFLRFSVPVEGLPLLESLLKSHGDFTSGFRGGVFLGNILMELLCAVLISLRNSSVDSLSEEKLLEWRGVVQDLLEAKFNLAFLLDHLRLLAHMLFQRQSFKSIDTEIAVAEEVLAHAHKVLQDLKVKRQRILSTLAVPVISPDASLLAGLIP